MSATSEPAVFRDEPLTAIVAHIRARLAAGDLLVRLEVLDPDHGRGLFAGERLTIDGTEYLHRPLRAWVDLAARLGLRLLTPRPAAPPRIELRMEPLADDTWHDVRVADRTEKYGADSSFARIIKSEDPDFVLDMTDALARIALAPDARVLELGVNRGDTLSLIADLVPGLRERGSFVGVDHSRSALAVARARFPRADFHDIDLADLPAHDLGAFDLIIAIDTLQSTGLDDRALLRHLVQRCLAPRGAVVLGVANCRYRDGEVIHGARMKNFREPELGLLFKDVAFYRKYLQQHGRTVHVTGKHEILITAVASPSRDHTGSGPAS